MLTPRQRQIHELRDRLDTLILSEIGFAAFCVGLAAVGLLVPVGAPMFFAAAAVDLVVVISLHLQASRLRRRLDELTYFAR